MKKRIFCALGLPVLLAFLFTACPNPADVSTDPTGGTLTITGLPSGGNYAVYIFSTGTDIASYEKISSAYAGGSYQAVGAATGNTFTLYKWANAAQGSAFTGSGDFPILLLNGSGTISDSSNPMYSRAAAAFTNGLATVAFSGFSAVVYTFQNPNPNPNPTPGTTYAVSGTITSNDPSGPLAGATVQLKSGDTAVGSAVTTGSDGTYTISNVSNGTYTIDVSKTGYNSATIGAVTVAGAASGGHDLELINTATPAFEVSGTITGNDPSGPLAGATVQLKQGTVGRGSTTTAGDGTYTIINVFNGTYTIEVSKEGYNTGTISAVTVSGANSTGHDLELISTASANLCTVTFNTDGGTAIVSQSVSPGGFINQPANPVKEGHTFDNWYTDTGFAYLFNFSQPVNATTTVYAKWTVNQYTVSFNGNGGSPAPGTQTLAYGIKIEKPANPVKKGYMLAGWYSDSSFGGSPWDFDTGMVPGSNITLHAKWEAIPAEDSADFDGLPSDQTFPVSSVTDWNSAVSAINDAGSGSESAPKNYVIELGVDFSLSGTTYNNPTFGVDHIKVSLRGSQTITMSGSGVLLDIKGNQTIILRDVNLKGRYTSSGGGNFSVVLIQSGRLEMKGVSKIFGNDRMGSSGGGVYMLSGTFIMNDNASVCNNIVRYNSNGGSGGSGGGVIVSSGTFIMNDNASVSNNQAYDGSGGGGVFLSGSGVTFVMNGNATISNNSVSGKYDQKGGGIFRYSANNIRITGGTVSNNTVPTSQRGEGANLYGSAEYGTFDSEGNWVKKGDLGTTNDTIRVVNGDI